VPTVALPVNPGTVRPASLHQDHRPSDQASSPFESMLDTGASPRIPDKPAPRNDRSDRPDQPRHSDKAAKNNTTDSKPAPAAAKSDASSDASQTSQDGTPESDADPKDPKVKVVKAEIDLAAATVAPDVPVVADTTDQDKKDDTAKSDDTAAPVTATPTDELLAATAPIAPIPAPVTTPTGDTITAVVAAPAQAIAPAPVTTPDQSNTDTVGVTAVGDATTTTPAAPVAAQAVLAADVSTDPQPVKPAGKAAAKDEKHADAVKPDADAKPDLIEAVTAKTDNAGTPKTEAPKTQHQTQLRPDGDDTPVEHKSAHGKAALEAAGQGAGNASAPAAVRNDAAASLAARPDLPVQAQAPTLQTASAAPAALTQNQAPLAAAIPISGLGVEIATQARDGKNRFEIRLDPPDLGRVDVRLDIDGQGNVTSRLVVERQDTLDLLRRESSSLERALNDAGLRTSNDGLQFSLRDQSFNQAQRDNTGGGRFTRVAVPIDAASGNDTPSYRLPRLGGLDIRV